MELSVQWRYIGSIAKRMLLIFLLNLCPRDLLKYFVQSLESLQKLDIRGSVEISKAYISNATLFFLSSNRISFLNSNDNVMLFHSFRWLCFSLLSTSQLLYELEVFVNSIKMTGCPIKNREKVM